MLKSKHNHVIEFYKNFCQPVNDEVVGIEKFLKQYLEVFPDFEGLECVQKQIPKKLILKDYYVQATMEQCFFLAWVKVNGAYRLSLMLKDRDWSKLYTDLKLGQRVKIIPDLKDFLNETKNFLEKSKIPYSQIVLNTMET